METQHRIASGAHELFHRYGIKSVTMDDIAKHLGMSKKTIYQFFKDKDELVLTLTDISMNTNSCALDDISKIAIDAVDEIIQTMKYMAVMFTQMNPNLFYDMQKYHPESWQKFKAFKETSITGCIERNLERGVSEGLYRKSVNIKIIAKLRTEEIEMAMNPAIFPAEKFNLLEVQVQLLAHFLHGITTLKGHKLINKYNQVHEDEN